MVWVWAAAGGGVPVYLWCREGALLCGGGQIMPAASEQATFLSVREQPVAAASMGQLCISRAAPWQCGLFGLSGSVDVQVAAHHVNQHPVQLQQQRQQSVGSSLRGLGPA